VEFIFTQPTGMLTVYFSLTLTVGVSAALPFILLQAVKFVAPALYPREKVFLYAMLPAVLLAFVVGVWFAYVVLLPPAFKFLLNFGSDIATPLISISDYISLVTRLLFWVGVVFETPIVFFILARIGIVNSRMLLKRWRWAILGAFVLGAVITPTPDPVNQTLAVLHMAGNDDTAFWTNFNWEKAVAAGMASVGAPFSGQVDFVSTESMWPITHMVAPAQSALKCRDCHASAGRLEKVSGIYIPGRGSDHATWLDGIGWALAALALFGALAHGSGRIFVSRRRT